MHPTFDDTEWSVDPAEPDVGIFTEAWAHETCDKDYEQGCSIESSLSGRTVRAGAVYAEEHFTLTCNDCGAVTSFTGEALMGFEGEQGV